MTSSAVRRNAASSKPFFAVLNADGVMVDQDNDAQEAYERARHASPTGTVVVDSTVTAEQEPAQNPAGKLRDAAQWALRDSRIPKTSHRDWSGFDPITNGVDRNTVRDAREALRTFGREEYAKILAALEDDLRVHRPQEAGEVGKRGGVARQFNPGWLAADFLRQNQKMAKVLSAENVMHDSIGLSLIPHGAAFREAFSTSTSQGSLGGSLATFCRFSTAECRKVCLVNTGQRALESGAFASSYLFSRMIRHDPDAFLINVFDRCVQAFLDADVEGRRAYLEAFKQPAPRDMQFRRFIRLNVLSDLPWELLAPGMIEAACNLARRIILGCNRYSRREGLSMYDYSKIPYRRGIDGYYDITWSFSGSMMDTLFDVINGDPEAAPRAAVVFVKREETPSYSKRGASMYRPEPGSPLSSDEQWHSWEFLGQRVWNGDLSDVRPLDPVNVRVVGLTYKPPHYKVAAPIGSKKKFSLEPVVPETDLDKQLPSFLVRVRQPDPEAPPIVIATQDPENRRLVLPTVSELESLL